MGLANLGNPGAANAQGYGADQAGIYGQQGNAQAAGQIGAGNAYSTGLQNLTNLAGQAATQYGSPYGYPNNPQAGQPGYGVLA